MTTSTQIGLYKTGDTAPKTGRYEFVRYTDNTTATLTQTMSDWLEPQSFSGETVGVATGAWNVAGRRSRHNAFVYQYNLALDSTKTVSSLTLPNNVNVKVLAVTLVR